MVALTITAAEVQANSAANRRTGVALHAIVAGQAVALDATQNNRVVLADANDANRWKVVGIAENSAAAGQQVSYLTPGSRFTVTTGSFTQGTPYFLGATPGTIVPFADLVTGDKVVYVGVGISTTEFEHDTHASGVAVP